MAMPFSFLKRLDKGENRRKWRRDLKLSTGIFLILSLLFSLGDGLVFSFGWLAMGIMAIMLLYRLLEKYYFLTFWLSGVYILLFLGSMIAFIFAERTGNWFLMIFGYSILIAAFIASLYLILFIKERRDMISMEGEYVPIGLWSLMVLAFFWSSLFSILGWVRWADGSLGSRNLYLLLYFTGEIIIIPLFILIPSYPEERFRTPYMELQKDEGFIRNLLNNITGHYIKEENKARSSKSEVYCPLCGSSLKKEIRKCPSCDSPRFFYWCERCEDFFVRCPNCRKLTAIGRERCLHCSIKMSDKIKCSRCGDIHRALNWLD